ncbi:hypothetical protein [Rosistilla carotiformis]|nr:hypothetical protein [Rosistilla carotiformis]
MNLNIMTIRASAIFLIAGLLQAHASADEFEVFGTPTVFTVTPEILARTPTWNAGEEPIPCGIVQAIKVAKTRHEKTVFKGFGDLHAWAFHRAILVSEDENRFYWLVTYKGPYDPSLFRGPGGYSYPDARTRYIHYPVLMNGQLAPELPLAAKQTRFQKRLFDSFDFWSPLERTGWPHLSRDLDEFAGDRDDDPFAPAEGETNRGEPSRAPEPGLQGFSNGQLTIPAR